MLLGTSFGDVQVWLMNSIDGFEHWEAEAPDDGPRTQRSNCLAVVKGISRILEIGRGLRSFSKCHGQTSTFGQKRRIEANACQSTPRFSSIHTHLHQPIPATSPPKLAPPVSGLPQDTTEPSFRMAAKALEVAWIIWTPPNCPCTWLLSPP